VFTAIINNRLTKYADEYDLIKNNQAGFRKNHSTIDNLFVLHTLLDILGAQKKKTFLCIY
jgi:hypothetical protein